MPVPPPVPPALDPSLVAQLARLGVTLGAPTAAPQRVAAVPRPPSAARDDTGPRPDVLPIESAVPGRQVDNTHGHCYVSTARRASHEHHCGIPLRDALAASSESLAALARDATLADLDLGRAAFLDTETTGLAGGTGTYAFLIGVGRFVDETYQVRQFFMRDPSEERAQLAEVADWVADCSGLVTFNGKSFDVPLLTTRFALHGLELPVRRVPHLDLLPAARRLWRRRLPSCALTSLEQHIFGLERVDDVPGWLIPDRYFRYQVDGDARPLVGIFEHNALDILTMVSLATRVADAYGAPELALRHGPDWLSVALQYQAAGDHARTIAACDRALAHDLAVADADEALATLALAARRAGDWDRATAAWRRLAESQPPRRLFPFEELAKYYEHQERTPDVALGLVQQAQALVSDGTLRPRRGRRQALAELEHRRARLERKVGRV